MTRVLIIYENIPESTDLFIVDANESELADLKLCHGNYTNAVDNEEIEKHCLALMQDWAAKILRLLKIPLGAE